MPRKKRFQHRKKQEKIRRTERLKSASNPALSQVQSSSLQQISAALVFPSGEWSNPSSVDSGKLQLCKIPQVSGSSSQPLHMCQSQVENEHYSTVSGLIQLVISLECFIEITPDFLYPFMND